jgi:hypothetical protein
LPRTQILGLTGGMISPNNLPVIRFNFLHKGVCRAVASSAVFCIALFASVSCFASGIASKPEVIVIPYMERASMHRRYADQLLELALDRSIDKYGPYQLHQHSSQTVIRRQLQEMELDKISVAIAMPSEQWMEKTIAVPYPIMKGLASYRMFFALSENQQDYMDLPLAELRTLKVGQGQGWSTAKILEDNQFDVIYGSSYETLFPMLRAGRFQLLMRGVYEVEAERRALSGLYPEIAVVDDFAAFTYLPMYFFVNKKQADLAQRLQYGLEKIEQSGEANRLFEQLFSSAIRLMEKRDRKIIYLENSNIDDSYFQRDKAYLLDRVVQIKQSQ